MTRPALAETPPPAPGALATGAPSGRVQLAAVFRKEVRQTVRDRRIMFMLIVAPLVQTVIFGFAVDFDVDRVPTVVVIAVATARFQRRLA